MVNIKYEQVTLSKAKYGWSKYGGARHGLVKQGGQWYCQACGEEQPDNLPAYMMCIDNGGFREFIRLCSVCEHTVKKLDIKIFQELKRILKKESEWKKYKVIFR